MLEQNLVESTDATKFKELNEKLQLATKEIEILQKSYSDLEKSYKDLDKFKEKLNKESKLTTSQVFISMLNVISTWSILH